MARRRRHIAARIEDEVLFLADHTCCICRTRGKDVHLHHIDGNTSNNARENLAVVCLDCHSSITGTRGLGRSYKPGEVRKYKRSWEQQVFASRRIHRPVARYNKELISQIDLVVCEILACEKNNRRAAELLGLLYELHLWRGNRDIDTKIIEGLRHLAVMSGLGSPRLAGMVAEKIWEMCHQFVGPRDVPMNRHDLKIVLSSVEALATLADFNCMVGHGRKAADIITKQMEAFFDVGIWYSKKSIVNALIAAYEKALRSCYLKGRLDFLYGRTTLRGSIRRVRQMLLDEKPEWRHQKRCLEHLLSI